MQVFHSSYEENSEKLNSNSFGEAMENLNPLQDIVKDDLESSFKNSDVDIEDGNISEASSEQFNQDTLSTCSTDAEELSGDTVPRFRRFDSLESIASMCSEKW